MDLQAQYFTKAFEAYSRKEYKYSLVLLKKVELSEYEAVSLLVNCSYDYWKETVISTAESKLFSSFQPIVESNQISLSSTDKIKSIVELIFTANKNEEVPNKEYNSVLTTIKESFTKLLANVKAVPIKQYDYIRLTHVYLAEGSYHGALQILQLASARGFLEDPLIVLQSYTIMKRISKEADAESTMVFLSSTLIIEAMQRKRSSNSRSSQRIHSSSSSRTNNSNKKKDSTDRIQAKTKQQQQSTTQIMNKKLKNNQLLLQLNTAPVQSRENSIFQTNTNKESIQYVSNSDLPIQCLYLYCATFLQSLLVKTVKHSPEYSKLFQEFIILLAESYFLIQNQVSEDIYELIPWFNHPQLWLDMAMLLDTHTPYILLSQDAYWEAFMRSPLQEFHILSLVFSLLRNKAQAEEIVALLLRAVAVCPWNLLLRDLLSGIYVALSAETTSTTTSGGNSGNLRSSDINAIITTTTAAAASISPATRHLLQQWMALFSQHILQCIAIQRMVKGWRLRRHWSTILPAVLLRKQNYADKKLAALRKYTAIWRGHQHALLRCWKRYVEAYKALKYNSACLIQAVYRCYTTQRWYQYKRLHIKYINCLYIVAYQQQRDKTRISYFQTWYQKYFVIKKRKSADILCNILYMNGYSRILRNGMDFILVIIRLKRKHLYHRVMRHWHAKQQKRRRLRAHTTIRFFIRRIYKNIEMKKKEIELKERIQLLNNNNNSSSSSSKNNQYKNKSLLKKVFLHWLSEYRHVVYKNRINNLSTQLALLYYRNKARIRMKYLYIRQSAQHAYLVRHSYLMRRSIFIPWKYATSVVRIQRAIRLYLAKKKYSYLLFLKNEIMNRIYQKKLKIMKNIFYRIKKYNYLIQKERIRGRKVLQLFYEIIKKRKLIRNKCTQKKNLCSILFQLHFFHCRKSFQRLKIATIYAHKHRLLHRLGCVAIIGTLRAGWVRWLRLCRAQAAARGLVQLCIVRPLQAAIATASSRSGSSSSSYSIRSNRNTRSASSNTDQSSNTTSSNIDTAEPVYSNLPTLFHTHTSQKLNTIIKEINPYTSINTTELIGTISNTILYDNKIRFQLKIFKIWFVFSRIRQRILQETIQPLSYYIYNNTINMIKIRIDAVLKIQNYIKKIQFNQKLKKELKFQQKSHEIYMYIVQKGNYKRIKYVWKFLKKYIVYKYNSIVRIQAFFRMIIAKKLYFQCMYEKNELIKKESELRNRYEGRLVRQCMYKFTLYYCMILNSIITKQYNNNRASDSNNNGINIIKIKERNRFQLTELSQPQKKVVSSRDTALLRLQNPTQSLKNSKTQEFFLNKTKKPTDIIGNTGFFETLMSRQHLIRLKETNTFLYDCMRTATTTAATSNTILYSTSKKPTGKAREDSELHAHLSEKELVFCIENATLLHCQGIKKAALRLITTHFSGSKLVLRSGEVTVNSIHAFLSTYFRIQNSNSSSTTTSVNNNSNNNEFRHSQGGKGTTHGVAAEHPGDEEGAALLALQLASLSLGMSARLALIHCIADSSDSPGPAQEASGLDKRGVSRISQLSIDTDSFGLLGTAVLLASLQFNRHLRVLTVSVSDAYLQCYQYCLIELSRNSSIEELKFYGAVVTVPVLRGLLVGVKSGFIGLRVLEFTIDIASVTTTSAHLPSPPPRSTSSSTYRAVETELSADAGVLSERIIGAAKDRAYVGRNGLSVTVNYR